MAKYKIEYNREGCIGAAACEAIAPDVWKLSDDDGKANLEKGKPVEGKDCFFEREFDDENLQKNLDAAKQCPAGVIKVINLETGDVLWPES